MDSSLDHLWGWGDPKREVEPSKTAKRRLHLWSVLRIHCPAWEAKIHSLHSPSRRLELCWVLVECHQSSGCSNDIIEGLCSMASDRCIYARAPSVLATTNKADIHADGSVTGSIIPSWHICCNSRCTFSFIGMGSRLNGICTGLTVGSTSRCTSPLGSFSFIGDG